MSFSKDKLVLASFQFISVNQSIVGLKRVITTKQWTTINRNLTNIVHLIKDVRANCFCASLTAHANSHATSCIERER